uniref:Interleukin-7 n=1 Tax=Anser cygnoides TaxID=8845 RepID=A0A8B9D6R3_ANSCY
MYLYMVLLLLSCRASSYFIPPKAMPFLQKINKTSIIEEIICLLDAEKTSLNEDLCTPTSLKIKNCAHRNIDKFIHELSRLNISKCMTLVKIEMSELEKNCSVLKEETTHESNCKNIKADFSKFKNNLKEFLKWVYETFNCTSTVRNEVDLYTNNCTCPRLRRYRKGWPEERVPWAVLGPAGDGEQEMPLTN